MLSYCQLQRASIFLEVVCIVDNAVLAGAPIPERRRLTGLRRGCFCDRCPLTLPRDRSSPQDRFARLAWYFRRAPTPIEGCIDLTGTALCGWSFPLSGVGVATPGRAFLRTRAPKVSPLLIAEYWLYAAGRRLAAMVFSRVLLLSTRAVAVALLLFWPLPYRPLRQGPSV